MTFSAFSLGMLGNLYSPPLHRRSWTCFYHLLPIDAHATEPIVIILYPAFASFGWELSKHNVTADLWKLVTPFGGGAPKTKILTGNLRRKADLCRHFLLRTKRVSSFQPSENSNFVPRKAKTRNDEFSPSSAPAVIASFACLTRRLSRSGTHLKRFFAFFPSLWSKQLFSRRKRCFNFPEVLVGNLGEIWRRMKLMLAEVEAAILLSRNEI